MVITLLDVTRTLPGYLVQLVFLLVLLGVKIGRLAEERRRGVDLDPRRPAAAAAGFLVVGLVLGILGKFAVGFTDLFDRHLLQYVQNIVTASTYFSLLFLYRPAGGLRVPQVGREVGLFVVVWAALASLTGVMWLKDLPNDDSTQTLFSHPTTGAFYLIALSYFIYLDVAVAIPTIHYLCGIHGRLRRRMRVGLGLIALAATMHAVAVTTRFCAVVASIIFGSRSELLYSIASPLYNLGNPVLILGLVAPLLAGRIVAARQEFVRRHRYARMLTLSSTALSVFPEIEYPTGAISPPAGAGAGPAERSQFRFRYVERVTQCRDAINRAEGFGEEAPHPDGSTSPVERFWAELVACGIDCRREYPDLDAEAQAYAELSTRLQGRNLSWL